MSEHTPGPWSAEEGCNPILVPMKAVYCERLGFQIGFVNTDRKSIESEAEANALLIAAAPDLLQALKAIAAPNQITTGRIAQATIQRWQTVARAAIAKATS